MARLTKKGRKNKNLSPWIKAKVIKAPAEFNLLKSDRRKELLDFLTKIKATARIKGHYLLDFSSTRKMFADGTLLFRAQLCRLNDSRVPGQIYRFRFPHDRKIKEVLKQTGILDIVGQSLELSPKHHDVVHWNSANGIAAEGEKYNEVLGHYEGRVARRLLSGLYVGITEAMTNTSHHAYIDSHSGESGWWMFSQSKDGKLYVAFCDLGIGIPGSLPIQRPSVFKQLQRLERNARDSDCIEAAVKDSVSRTKKSHRGKGLYQITRVLMEHQDDAQLIIYSNRGCYIRKTSEEKLFDYKDSINGTMICWQTGI
ncbi:hypothetical protein [Thiolapillus sp.]